MAITYAKQKAPENIEKHYTPAALARRLIKLVPINARDVVIDPAAGKNKVFVRQFPASNCLHCEETEGTDFLSLSLSYDWAITNPPYHLLWRFIDKASLEARQGFAFLVNINGINTLTPKRLELLRERGFHMRALHICQVRKWFGRYYFYVFDKNSGMCSLTWDVASWEG